MFQYMHELWDTGITLHMAFYWDAIFYFEMFTLFGEVKAEVDQKSWLGSFILLDTSDSSQHAYSVMLRMLMVCWTSS